MPSFGPDMMNHAISLNVIACLVLVIGGITSCIFSYKENRGNRRFVFRATLAWTFGLTAWLTLWVFYWTGVFHWGEEGTLRSTLAMLLSDVNTASGFLFYVIITRGQRERIRDHILDALPLLTLPAVATLSILAYDWWSHANVHTGLSLAYSMITPVLVGWAIRLRFIVVLPLALSCLYAILQPPAYGALFSKDPSMLSEQAGLAIIVLAIAKIVWGSVVFYALARKVSDTESIVRRVSVSRIGGRPESFLFYIQLSLGLIVLLSYLISLREEGRYLLTATAEMVAIAVGIVAVVLGILTYDKKKKEPVNIVPEDLHKVRKRPARRNAKKQKKATQ